MLGKLLKHEWRATARRYGLFYLILAAMTLFAVIIHAIPVKNVFYTMGETAFLVLYIFVLCGVAFCSTGMAVVRFYKNMVSDEGYLTFTLPAKVEQLVLTKFIVAFLWQMLTVVLIVLSLLTVFVVGHVEWSAFSEVISFILEETGAMLPILGVTMLISMMYQMLMFYLSIAIGQIFGHYKILASVIAYCVIGFGLELIMMIIILAICGIIGFVEVGEFIMNMSNMNAFYLISIAWSAVLAVIAYFVTCRLLKRKLNLV